MPRKPREFSTSNVYHIIFRGNDRQDLFYDNQDRYVFLNILKEAKEKFNLNIYVYCLMNNHIHLIIKVKDEFLSSSMQNLEVRYSMYFHKKINRTGHLFENRFYSRKIENLNYFLVACKYVHRNPEKANIEKTEKYRWSSFQEYISKRRIIDADILLHYFGDDLRKFKEYTLENDDRELMCDFAEFELKNKLTEEELANIIKVRFNLKNAGEVSLLNQDEKDKILISLKEMQGTSIAQISRVTRVTPYYIKKIFHRGQFFLRKELSPMRKKL